MKHAPIRAGFVLLLLTSCAPAYYDAPVDGWQTEDSYWRSAYPTQPYYAVGVGYETYQPAYLYGVETYRRYPGRRFEDISDAELRAGWERSHHDARLDWPHARQAAHAAYSHMDHGHDTHRDRDSDHDMHRDTGHDRGDASPSVHGAGRISRENRWQQ